MAERLKQAPLAAGVRAPAGSRFFAVPVKFKGLGTFPVRAFGLVDEA